MIPVIQEVVLPLAGLALLWLARLWVMRIYRPKPKRRLSPQEKAEQAEKIEKIRRDWGL